MSAQRVQGWRLQKEVIDAGVRAAEGVDNVRVRGEPKTSALATKLLLLWCIGTLSAIQAQQLALAAILDKAEHTELGELASCGNWGEWPSNCHRDILSKFCGDIKIAHPILVPVPCLDPKSSKETVENCAVFLPCLHIHALSQHYPHNFENMFSVGKTRRFWERVQASGDPKLVGHPMLDIPNWQDVCIPLWIHGDGAEFQNRDSIMIWSFGSILANGWSVDSCLFIAAFVKSCSLHNTWDIPMDWLKWCADCLLRNRFSTTGVDGQPFPRDHPLAEFAGKTICPQGFRFVYWCIEGDHEFFANTLHLPHWRNDKMCWDCDCDVKNPLKTWKELRVAKQGWRRYSLQDVLRHPSSEHIIFSFPGVTTKNTSNDVLHVLYTKGVLAHLLGSVLHALCWPMPGRQRVSPADRLAMIFDNVRAYYHENSSSTKLTNLTLRMFCDPDKPHVDHPFLGLKGSEMKHLVDPLLSTMIALTDGSEYHQRIVMSLVAISQFIRVLDAGDIVLTEQEFHLAVNSAYDFLGHYQWLHEYCVTNETQLFHTVPKFHTFQHLAEHSKYMNPRFNACFKTEDYIGQISDLAASIATGNRSTRVSEKLAEKLRFMVHLHLTREQSQNSD